MVSLLPCILICVSRVRYPISVGIDPAAESELISMLVTSEPVQVTPAQLQYEIVGKPLEHSHPDFPALDTCKPLAILHITESTRVVGLLDGTDVGILVGINVGVCEGITVGNTVGAVERKYVQNKKSEHHDAPAPGLYDVCTCHYPILRSAHMAVIYIHDLDTHTVIYIFDVHTEQ